MGSGCFSLRRVVPCSVSFDFYSYQYSTLTHKHSFFPLLLQSLLLGIFSACTDLGSRAVSGMFAREVISLIYLLALSCRPVTYFSPTVVHQMWRAWNFGGQTRFKSSCNHGQGTYFSVSLFEKLA